MFSIFDATAIDSSRFFIFSSCFVVADVSCLNNLWSVLSLKLLIIMFPVRIIELNSYTYFLHRYQKNYAGKN